MPENRTAFQRYGFAIVAVVVAVGLRLALDGLLDPHQGVNTTPKHVFIFFILATILATWFGGLGPSILTAVSGFALGSWFFLPPRHSFYISNFTDVALPPLFLQLTIIFFGWSMHKARKRADQSARDARRAEEEVRTLNMKLEERVAARTAELVIANQELESFTYSVSHDLRAPLRHVDGFAQFLEEEYGPQIPVEAQALVKKIRRGSQNMGHLVDDLLNLSRIGKKELTRQPTELTPLVESAMADIKLDSGDRKIEWRTEPLPSADCDPGLIKQVFINLLSNAAKYTRRREDPRIEIGQKPVDGNTAIFIRDNGVGFNMKYAGKLFGVFQRLHRPEDFEGTGVGLATVARIVRKHGGSIWAEAEVDKGATFFFTLGPGSHGNPSANGQPH